MLFLLTILILVAAVAALAVAVKRQARPNLLPENRPKDLPDPAFRPLFEPGREELRAEAREKDAEAAVAEAAEAKLKLDTKIDKLKAFREEWRAAPTRKNTVELLYLASQCESGKIYSETAHEAAKLWKNGQIENLSADDLSQLLESHLWLLPAGERTSGVSFSIQHEIADLRSAVQG